MNKKYEGEYLRKAHTFSMNNYEKLKQDEGVCGCFSCCSIFRPYEIKEFITDDKETAICPFCYEAAIIGSYSGFPIVKEFLEAMNDQWFDGDRGINWNY